MLEKERFLAIKKLARDIREDNKDLFKKINKKSIEEAVKEKEEFLKNIVEEMNSAFSDGEQGREEKQIFKANILIPDDDEFYSSYSKDKNIRNLMKKYMVNIEDIMSKITELNLYGKYIDKPEEKEESNLKDGENLLDEIDVLSNTLTDLELTNNYETELKSDDDLDEIDFENTEDLKEVELPEPEEISVEPKDLNLEEVSEPEEVELPELEEISVEPKDLNLEELEENLEQEENKEEFLPDIDEPEIEVEQPEEHSKFISPEIDLPSEKTEIPDLEIEESHNEENKFITVESEEADEFLDESFDNINNAISGFVTDFHNLKDELKTKEATIADLEEEIKNITKENDKLKSTQSKLQSENDKLKATGETLKEEQAKLKEASDKLKSDNDSLKSKNDSLKTENEKLNSTTKSLQSENENLRETSTTLRNENDDLKSANETLKSENERLNHHIKEVEERLRKSAILLKKLYNGINK